MRKIWLEHYAPGVPETVQLEDITLSDALARTARRFGNQAALTFQGTVISFQELDEMCSRFSAALTGIGVKPGDRVAILLPNLVQLVVAFFGAMRAGATLVMNNPLYTDRELEYQFNDSGSTYLVTLDLLVPRMIELRSKTAIKGIIACHIRDFLPFPLKQIFPFVRKRMHLKSPPAPELYEFVDLVKRRDSETASYQFSMTDTAVIMYTGGTTGVSKGVELTHGNISWNCQQGRVWFKNLEDGAETAVGCLPFFHSFGMTTAMNISAFYGWNVILIPKPEPKAILDAIDKHKATYIAGVPTLYNGMIHYPDLKKYSLRSLRLFFSGGAALPLETLRKFEEMTGAQICEGYGLTETSPGAIVNPFGGLTKPGTIGLPIPNTDAKLVDVENYDQEITTIGEPGELCVKGPQIMKGYLNRPVETAETIRDGWLLTGDIAVMDEEGYFTVVDRKKDMIISGGFNIYPREVEEVLYSHPDIVEACAIGIPDEYSGERIKAFIVRQPDATIDEDGIIAFCSERMVKYKIPKYIEFVDDLPKSAVGKILRKELRARELSNADPTRAA